MTIEFHELEPVDRSDQQRGRRRIVGSVAAAMLIAAAGGVGYGIGRGVDRNTAANDAGSESAAPDESSSDVDAITPPTTEESAATTAPMSEESESGSEGGAYTDAPVQMSGGQGYAAFGAQPMDTIFERSTPSGYELRVQLGQVWEGEAGADWGAGDWRPAPWCYESGQLRVSMSGSGLVDVGGVSWYSEPFNGRAVSTLLLGGNDGSPQWVVVVQVPADATHIRVVFADGSIDEVAPQGGIAALTAPGEASIPVTDGGDTHWEYATPEFEVTIEGGAEPVTLGSDGAGTWDDPEFRESCTPPPPALPDAGVQPADPTAAEAEIRAAMSTLYGIVGTGETGTDLIDDPTGVAEAREQVQAGGYADDASSATATIDELVFTAPDEAWFRYTIDTDGNDFANRFGTAVLVDGVWKITRATVCQDLSLAGGDCGGNSQTIFPPGAYPDEGYVLEEGAITATTVLE